MLAQKLLSGGGAETLYVDDLFQVVTYQGNGSTQTITNGIDLAGKGGLVWIKNRIGANPHILSDTSRGAHYWLESQSTAAQQYGGTSAIASFDATGFTTGSTSSVDINGNGTGYASWTFRNAYNFSQVLQVTKSAGSNLVIDLTPYMAIVGMVKVKRTDAAGSWYIWHRSLSAGKLLTGETTAAEATLGHITVVGTTLTLVNGVIADGAYHIEAYAHDTSTDGIIQCGSISHTSGAPDTVTLGWEPQYVLMKISSGSGDWVLMDSARGMPVGAAESYVVANTSNAESTSNQLDVTATGFTFTSGQSTGTFIYLAIRRPNKPPTSGTQVYNAIARTGTGAAWAITSGIGFAPDLWIDSTRNVVNPHHFGDRLRGAGHLTSETTSAEDSYGNNPFTKYRDGIDGISLTGTWFNGSGDTYIEHFFRRAVGVMDICCYTGTGVAKTEAHNLGVVPEMMIIKERGPTGYSWAVYHKDVGNTKILTLNTTGVPSGAASSYFNNTDPTASVFTVANANTTGNASSTYVAYLFATKAGISSCFSYTGNGTSQGINCGFSTGSRFILLKRADSTGDWYIWDSVRGVTSGNDPHLSLNTIAAEVTTDDTVDPFASGFTINQVAATNMNVNGASYIGLSFA